MVRDTLKHCLPLIRLYNLSSEEFVKKIRPYRKLFKQHLYENLLNSYLDPNYEPEDDILLPRKFILDDDIESKIVN
jgi:hypothetical protein